MVVAKMAANERPSAMCASKTEPWAKNQELFCNEKGKVLKLLQNRQHLTSCFKVQMQALDKCTRTPPPLANFADHKNEKNFLKYQY